jgi:hypothetical protein
MGYWRIHESIRILPGVHLNIGKSGVSLSLGGRGATINLSRRGTRETIGLPGTGISYVENQPWSTQTGAGLGTPRRHRWLRWVLIVIALCAAVYWALPDHAPASAQCFHACSPCDYAPGSGANTEYDRTHTVKLATKCRWAPQ